MEHKSERKTFSSAGDNPAGEQYRFYRRCLVYDNNIYFRGALIFLRNAPPSPRNARRAAASLINKRYLCVEARRLPRESSESSGERFDR